jgi:Helicase conserved C-terminal domain/WYL domain
VTSTLRRWLAGRTQDEFAGILERRSDVLEPIPPADLGEVAERLHRPMSLRFALQKLPQPCLDVLETLLVFGSGGMTRAALEATLHLRKNDKDLDAVLATCAMWAIAWDLDGQLWVPGALRSQLPSPLLLGPPVVDLLSPRTVDDLRARATALGLTPKNRKTDILQSLADFYADGDAIRAIVAAAPPDQRAAIEHAAWRNPIMRHESAYLYARHADPAISWLLTHGLVTTDWQQTVVPREVSLAIRGADWHPTLTSRPPSLAGTGPGIEVVDRDAAAAANTAIEQFGAVVEASGATPIALLKTGGVGVREIRRLSKSTRVPEAPTRLWLEIAYAGDLIDVDEDELVPTPSFDEWAARPPADRLAVLVGIWLDLHLVPLGTNGTDDASRPALAHGELGPFAAWLRPDVLQIAADLPDGTPVADQTALVAAVTWRRPIVSSMLADHEAGFIDATWTEAHLLGLVGRNALSSLGRAAQSHAGQSHAGQSHADVATVARAFVQDATDKAIFQADLTVVVPGVPTTAMANLIDAVADRESRGVAGTWRCSPESIRRALDAGYTADGILDALRDIAVGGSLPQPLEYLVADVARRHGALRVRAVGCLLHADDPTLLAELAATKSLAALQLSVVAPTVLASLLPVERTLAALRAAGYAPVGESNDGAALIERRKSRRAPTRAAVLPFLPRDLVDDSDDFAARHGLSDDAGPADAATMAATLLAAADPVEVEEPQAPPRTPAPRMPAPHTPTPRNLAASTPVHAPSVTSPAGPRARSPQRLANAPVRMPTLRIVRTSASLLDPEEQHVLAQAIDNEREIRIEYTDGDGASTSRVIEPIELDGGRLVAWCQLREDERSFILGRITSVRGV